MSIAIGTGMGASGLLKIITALVAGGAITITTSGVGAAAGVAVSVAGIAKGNAPYQSENGKQFATTLMNEKYGVGNWSTSSSEYSQIKKWGDRAFS